MTIPLDRNVSIKEVEKFSKFSSFQKKSKSKYKDLEIEISKIWTMKKIIIPVVIGTLGVIKNGMRSNIEKIPGKISLEELQRITLLGTAHILRKVLSIDQ